MISEDQLLAYKDVGRKLNYLIESQQIQRLKEYGDTVDQSVFRLTNLLNNLLNWAHSNLKSLRLNPEEIVLEKVVQICVEEVVPMLERKQISLTVKVEEYLKTFSDEQAISTIIRNLLNNAIKFTPTSGKIKLFAIKQGDALLLYIRDNGIGMDELQLNDIFDLKKRKSTEGTEGERGTGLGLSVCKELALLNGGDITVESTFGVGTTFILQLPLFPQDKSHD